MTTVRSLHWQDRLRASGIHLLLSGLIAGLAAWLVFGLWYPYPYRDVSGGRALFLIVTSVDVILGPLITLTVFNRSKPRTELIRDLTIVGLIQLSALGYGLWTVFEARPVHMVFEFDRFRVVHAVDIPVELLAKTPTGVRALPLTGPTLLAVRPFHDANEEGAATMLALQGVSLSARPDLWQSYDQARARVLGAAKPLTELRQRFPQQAAAIAAAVARAGLPQDQLAYLPLISRTIGWTVLLDARTGDVRGFLPLDSF